jgi:hypothetical protein
MSAVPATKPIVHQAEGAGAGAGVSFTIAPSASAAAPTTPATIKEAIIERSAQAVIANLDKILGDELEEVGTAFKQSTLLPGAIAYTHSFKLPEGTKSFSYGLRPEKLKKEHIVKVEGVSGAKLNCYNSILNRCFAKIMEHSRLGLAFQLSDCEGLTPETFADSQLVRSFAFKVLSRVPEKAIALF